jgi:cell division cycle 20-like protein 1, cofactor of APC complex
MNTSHDMICDSTLPHHHGTPKQISPTGDMAFKASALTPATMSSAGSSPTSLDASPRTQYPNLMMRVPMPSPSRPRLDPRYAARLPPQLHTATPSTDLMPPPTVRRCESGRNTIFLPTPIITPTGGPEREHSFGSLSSLECWTPQRPPTKRCKPDFGTGDRFIPSRATSNFNFNLWEGISERSAATRAKNTSYNSNSEGDNSEHSNRSTNNADSSATVSGDSAGGTNTPQPAYVNTFATSAQQNLLSALLRTELLGENEDPARGGLLSSSTSNRLRFTSPRQDFQENFFDPTSVVNSFNLTPVNSAASERLIATPNKRKRRISKVPFKVLDAPALQDDFYLNLVDWSSHNVLAVGLGACVYLWSACTSKVTKLCDLSGNEDTVTAVSWAQRGTHLSVGTNKGEVQLWDTIKCKKVRSMSGHTARVGTLAWMGPNLASGSRDRLIYLRDVRVQAPYMNKLSNHRQEVCGLKWSFEEPSFLASGGNDNNLHVIDSRNPCEPLHKFTEHTAAVKAIAWSPHQHGLLASGGGTADRCIRFWNTLSGSSLNKIDTGSQVCNLAWSQNCNEIVSTHGYSLNQIVVWRYPSMSKVTTLTGHTFRVLYLAMSPDGSTVVTGAGDETLRFWQIFPGPRSDGKDSAGGLLFPNTLGSVIR